MSDAWEDIGAKRPTETYEEALARSLVGKTTAAKTEQELAEELVKQRERMKMHDELFADNFMPTKEQHVISRTLARQLGHFWNDNSRADGMPEYDQDPMGEQ